MDEKDEEMMPESVVEEQPSRSPLNPNDDVSITFSANQDGDMYIEYRWKDDSQETAVIMITLLDSISTGKLALHSYNALEEIATPEPHHKDFITSVLSGWLFIAREAIAKPKTEPVIFPSQVFKPKGPQKQ